MCNRIDCWNCGEEIVLDSEPYNLGCFQLQPTNNKESTPMYEKVSANYAYAAAVAIPQQSLEEKQRDTLATALSNARHEHQEKLQVHFGISDQEPPRNAKELVDRIKAGEYAFDTNYTEKGAWDYGCSMTYGLKWRNPKTKFDLDGFTAARKLLETAYADMKLFVWTLPLTEALDAVQLFKEKKFT